MGASRRGSYGNDITPHSHSSKLFTPSCRGNPLALGVFPSTLGGGGGNSLLPIIIMGILHHYRMEDIQSLMPAALPPLPKLRPRPGHLVAVGHVMTNRPITETSVATIEETGSTVSKLLMKSEFSRFRELQVRSPE